MFCASLLFSCIKAITQEYKMQQRATEMTRLQKTNNCCEMQHKESAMGICVLCGFNFFVSILNLRSWQQYPLPSIAWRSKTGEETE